MSSNEIEQTSSYSAEPSLYIPGTICVEGNIGSGKSTLLSGLKKAGYTVFEEPVDSRWGQHLATLYSDQKRWGFTFQVEVVDWYKHLVGYLQETSDKPAVGGGQCQLKIVERSPASTYEIFGKNLKNMGYLNDWEMKLLGKVVQSWSWIPEHTFYLKVPYADAYRRLKTRGREGEKNVPMELLNQLELRHEEFTKSRFCGKAHVLDGRLSKEEVVAQAIEKIREIQTEKYASALNRSRIL